MSEWWTYRLSDFLMFSPATYWRMVERYNREMWPLQWALLGVACVLLWLVASKKSNAPTLAAAALAVLWLWVAWAFHWERYAAINWAAQYLAAAGALQAVMLAGWALLYSTHSPRAVLDARTHATGLVLAVAGIVYPCVAFLAGRPWGQSEVFGLMPEPTALATLGLILASPLPRRGWLLVIPSLTFLTGLLTLWMFAG